MRRAERAFTPARGVEWAAADRGDGCHFQCFGVFGWRQHAGEARGEHGFAAAGRADQQQVVVAGCRNFQRAPGQRLTAHVGEVVAAGKGRRAFGGMRQRQGADAAEVRAGFQQRARDPHFDAINQRRFDGAGWRQDQAAPGCACGQGGGHCAIHGTDLAGQGQFAQAFGCGQRSERNLAAGGEDAERDRQVEAAAFLGQVGRGQVDGDAATGKFELCAVDGGAHPILALANCGFGQADDRHRRQAAGQVHLDANVRGIDADAGAAVHQRQAHDRKPSDCGRSAHRSAIRARRRHAPAGRVFRGSAAAPRAVRRTPRG